MIIELFGFRGVLIDICLVVEEEIEWEFIQDNHKKFV